MAWFVLLWLFASCVEVEAGVDHLASEQAQEEWKVLDGVPRDHLLNYTIFDRDELSISECQELCTQEEKCRSLVYAADWQKCYVTGGCVTLETKAHARDLSWVHRLGFKTYFIDIPDCSSSKSIPDVERPEHIRHEKEVCTDKFCVDCANRCGVYNPCISTVFGANNEGFCAMGELHQQCDFCMPNCAVCNPVADCDTGYCVGCKRCAKYTPCLSDPVYLQNNFVTCQEGLLTQGCSSCWDCAHCHAPVSGLMKYSLLNILQHGPEATELNACDSDVCNACISRCEVYVPCLNPDYWQDHQSFCVNWSTDCAECPCIHCVEAKLLLESAAKSQPQLNQLKADVPSGPCGVLTETDAIAQMDYKAMRTEAAKEGLRDKVYTTTSCAEACQDQVDCNYWVLLSGPPLHETEMLGTCYTLKWVNGKQPKEGRTYGERCRADGEPPREIKKENTDASTILVAVLVSSAVLLFGGALILVWWYLRKRHANNQSPTIPAKATAGAETEGAFVDVEDHSSIEREGVDSYELGRVGEKDITLTKEEDAPQTPIASWAVTGAEASREQAGFMDDPTHSGSRAVAGVTPNATPSGAAVTGTPVGAPPAVTAAHTDAGQRPPTGSTRPMYTELSGIPDDSGTPEHSSRLGTGPSSIPTSSQQTTSAPLSIPGDNVGPVVTIENLDPLDLAKHDEYISSAGSTTPLPPDGGALHTPQAPCDASRFPERFPGGSLRIPDDDDDDGPDAIESSKIHSTRLLTSRHTSSGAALALESRHSATSTRGSKWNTSTVSNTNTVIVSETDGKDTCSYGSAATGSRAGGIDRWVDLSTKKILGQGFFGCCYLSEMDGVEVVIKTPNEERGHSELLHETSILAKLPRHPCVIDYFGWCDVRHNGVRSIGVVYAYYRGGSLIDHLMKKGLEWTSNGRLTDGWHQVCRFARDIAAGVLFLHRENIIHRDLAARNILLDQMDGSQPRAVVGDIGFAKAHAHDSDTNNDDPVVSARWAAPEVLRQGSSSYSFASDTWSFGIVLWEMLSGGEIPWPRLKGRHVRKTAVLKHMEAHNLRHPEGTPQWMKDLTKRCWRPDPAKRCHITKALTIINTEVKRFKIVKKKAEVEM